MYKFILAIIVFLFTNPYSFAEVAMVTSIEDAVALSEDTKMPVLVIFGADWCKNCVNLKKDINGGIFDSDIDGYILCYIDIDKNKDLKTMYKVKSIPDSRIIESKVEKANIVGYETKKYKKWLSNASK